MFKKSYYKLNEKMFVTSFSRSKKRHLLDYKSWYSSVRNIKKTLSLGDVAFFVAEDIFRVTLDSLEENLKQDYSSIRNPEEALCNKGRPILAHF